MTIAIDRQTLLRCPNCDGMGALTWQPGAILPVLSGDFHVETGRSVPDARMLVCGRVAV